MSGGEAVPKHIPDPGFAGDDGTADPALVEALTDWAAGGPPDPVYAALVGGRVMVPVVAVAVSVDGPEIVHRTGADKATDMMLVTIRGEDGRTALPAFTSLAALTGWNAGGPAGAGAGDDGLLVDGGRTARAADPGSRGTGRLPRRGPSPAGSGPGPFTGGPVGRSRDRGGGRRGGRGRAGAHPASPGCLRGRCGCQSWCSD